MNASKLQEYAASPEAFRRDVLIDSDVGIVRLGSVLDDWQHRDFKSMDAAWLFAAGRADHCDSPTRGYFERPRGHSKTCDAAISSLWAVAFARRQVSGICAAGSKDQARLLRDSIERIVRANLWLSKVITLNNYLVKNRRTGSKLDIIAADASHSYGLLIDFAVVDEITNWGDAGEALWHSLLSASAKRKHTLLMLIANAGYGQGHSWQWDAREAARLAPSWHFNRLEGPVASWISSDLLVEQERLLPSQVYRRLWKNEWSSSLGDALTSTDIANAFNPELRPLCNHTEAAAAGYQFAAAGLDLSTKRDRSALTIVVGASDGVRAGRIRVARSESWRPGSDGMVPLGLVQNACRQAARDFQPLTLFYDPWQAALMIQQLTNEGIHCVEKSFSGPNCNAFASTLLQVFREQRISIPPDSELEACLARLNIEVKSFGYKLVAPKDSATGHADKAISLALILPDMMEVISSPPVPEPPLEVLRL